METDLFTGAYSSGDTDTDHKDLPLILGIWQLTLGNFDSFVWNIACGDIRRRSTKTRPTAMFGCVRQDTPFSLGLFWGIQVLSQIFSEVEWRHCYAGAVVGSSRTKPEKVRLDP